MPPLLPPTDETMWEHPALVPTFNLGPDLNTNNILWYFMNSTFYDQSSHNHSLIQFAAGLPPHEKDKILFNRANFEEALRAKFAGKDGVQFVVTHEAKDAGQPWVIEKQSWRVLEDRSVEFSVQAVYYTVGFKIYQAPSLLDVVQSRLLSVSSLMQELFETGRDLLHWSPAIGHTYMPPVYETAKAGASRAASRAGSIAPAGMDLEASQISTTQPVENQTTEFSDDFFLQSLTLTNRYGNEYMDENPLQGEPGSFVFASTNQQVEARNKAQAAAAAAQATAGTLALPVKPAEAESAVSSVAPTPKPLVPAPEAASRKASIASLPKVPKEKRRKSKGLASPINPPGA